MRAGDPWHQLRGLRADPPGKAAQGGRASLFRAALEQAEQLAESATASGYAARPIPLYYMVNQAARAIVAAHGDTTNISGHGLSVRNLDAHALNDVTVVADGANLLAALAHAIADGGSDFALLNGEVRPGVLWAYLPRCGTWAAQAGVADACALSIDSRERGSSDADAETVRLSGWPWSKAQVEPLTLKAVAAQAEELLRSRYDVSPGWSVQRTPPDKFFGNMPMVGLDAKVGAFSVDFVLARHARDEESTLGEVLAWETFGTTHRSNGEEWVLPSLPGRWRVHPLVAWYATLYVFSMLARYAPVAWRKHLDVDRSAHAVALQMTLDLALDDVPTLVRDALTARTDV